MNQKSNHHHDFVIMPKRETKHLSSLAPGQHHCEKTSQQWRTIGVTVFDLISPGIDTQTGATKLGGRKDFLGSLRDAFWVKKAMKTIRC